MNVFSVSFFGHRVITHHHPIEQKLEEIIRGWLSDKEYVEFLVGRDGDFDLIVSSAVKRCKREICNENSALVWVMPYEKAEYTENEAAFCEYYDEIEVCKASADSHFKAAHQIRNREMVDRSDLVIFFVERESGGAYRTMRYAQKIEKPYINLAEIVC